ncbi:adenylosuccinate lyase [Sarcoptes scabiei]|nr:adenylosuccinate lyase [Sarcoptes scabiei]
MIDCSHSQKFSTNLCKTKMPVKIEFAGLMSPSPTFLESGMYDFDPIDSFICEPDFPCLDDHWSNFIPTPPQSPQFEENLDENYKNIEDLQKLIAHDCMWSGQCMSGYCNSNKSSSNSTTSQINGNWIRPDTPFNLSTSPQSTFNYISSVYESNSNVPYPDDENNHDQSSSNSNQQNHRRHNHHHHHYQHNHINHHTNQSNQTKANNGNSQQMIDANYSVDVENVNNVFAMVNDHSYGSVSNAAIPIAQISEGVPESVPRDHHCISKKLTGQRSTISQARISKMKCKKVSPISSKHLKSSTLIKTELIEDDCNGNLASNDVCNVWKPTIISVENFKNLQETIHTKYKVSLKKKKSDSSVLISSLSSDVPTLELNNSTSSSLSPSNKSIQGKNTHPLTASNSPVCSDSEESSLSYSSSGDVDQISLNGVNCNNNNKTSPPIKRREHNDSERKRRDHLRNSFNNLRDQIPKLKTSQKRPPRIMILHEATSYVRNLIEKNDELNEIYQKETEKRNQLMEILKNLSESL